MATKISQATLKQFVQLRAAAEKAQAKLDAASDALLERLKGGANVAPGILNAELKTWERRYVNWADVVKREQGEEFYTRVLAATKPTTHEKLVVEAA